MSGKLRLTAPLMCSMSNFSLLRASRTTVSFSPLILMKSSSDSRRVARCLAASCETLRYPSMSIAGFTGAAFAGVGVGRAAGCGSAAALGSPSLAARTPAENTIARLRYFTTRLRLVVVGSRNPHGFHVCHHSTGARDEAAQRCCNERRALVRSVANQVAARLATFAEAAAVVTPGCP